jgi:FtsH-binding integral membrane protein
MRERRHMLPIWFFIGMLLSVYGIIILVTSLWHRSEPSSVVLAQYHPGIWGGIVLLLLGGFYVLRFRPQKGRDE